MSLHAKGKYPKSKRPKTKLGLPDLDHSKSAVLDSLRSPESKRGYRHAIDEFIQWYCSEPQHSFNRVIVTRYRIFLENRQLAGGNDQWTTRRCTAARLRSRGRWLAQSGTRCWHPTCERCQEVRCEAWELANSRRGPENWTRSNSFSGTSPYRQLNAISAASSGFVER
jgi:hypothetical protein